MDSHTWAAAPSASGLTGRRVTGAGGPRDSQTSSFNFNGVYFSEGEDRGTAKQVHLTSAQFISVKVNPVNFFSSYVSFQDSLLFVRTRGQSACAQVRQSDMLFAHHKDSLLFVHSKDIVVSAHNKDSLLSAHNKDIVVSAHNKDSLVSAHNKDIVVSAHHKDSLLSVHNQDIVVCAHNKDSLLSVHNKDIVVSAIHWDSLLFSHETTRTFCRLGIN